MHVCIKFNACNENNMHWTHYFSLCICLIFKGIYDLCVICIHIYLYIYTDLLFDKYSLPNKIFLPISAVTMSDLAELSYCWVTGCAILDFTMQNKKPHKDLTCTACALRCRLNVLKIRVFSLLRPWPPAYVSATITSIAFSLLHY